MHANQTTFPLLHWFVILYFAWDVWHSLLVSFPGAEVNGECVFHTPLIFKRKKWNCTVNWLKMPRECAAVGCMELHSKDSTSSFHTFPTKDPGRMKAWIVNMKRLELTAKKLWVPKRHDQLCSKHFELRCFSERTRLSLKIGLPYKPRLTDDAIPTIFSHNQQPRSVERSVLVKQRKLEVRNLMYLICVFVCVCGYRSLVTDPLGIKQH